MAASQTLRAALSKVEAAHPGFSYDLVLGLVRKADASSVNMNESLLRLQGAVSDQDCKFVTQWTIRVCFILVYNLMIIKYLTLDFLTTLYLDLSGRLMPRALT